ncbi:hypothetical protein E2K98_24350 [Bacillus salipaludis]|uniref:Spore germination protein n=1 Tax=Bacillus salipaludis TaxID=2547811 RepID=A0A4R5VJY4_9BACI|nr:spore germination protein [Bacillus salipaludis]MDQ6598891.1 spore germination protein [Bacillus salipaludis]TDK58206.1 hypothetical protein E2K98_24350 [Bacillus salipaludis]
MDKEVLSSDLSQNIEKLQSSFSQVPDLVIRRIKITDATFVYLKGSTDKNTIHTHVLRPLMESFFNPNNELPVTLGDVEIIYSWGDVENAILGGDSILLVSGKISGCRLETKGWPHIGNEKTPSWHRA